jgi:hypothetical protein
MMLPPDDPAMTDPAREEAGGAAQTAPEGDEPPPKRSHLRIIK